MANKYFLTKSFFQTIFRLTLVPLLLLIDTSSTVQAKSPEGRQNEGSIGIFPNDTYYIPYQWALNDLYLPKLNVPAAWSITTGTLADGSPEIVVAVLDTGLDQCHPDLASKNTGTGFNFAHNTTNIQDVHGHGTSVSGIIGAVSNNNMGVAGMSWGVKIMPIKVILKDNDTGLTGCGNIDADWVLKGIKYAADNGADIINLSLICQPTDSGQVSKWQEAVDYAYGKGVVIVAGAGNHDEDLDQVLPPVPVGLNHVIAVGATNIYDERCDRDNICEYDSGHGSKLDVMAPGMSIATTTPVTLVNSSCPISINEDDAYTLGDFGGTSAATPFVSGLAALMLSANPNLRDHPDQVEYIIQRTAFDLGVPGRDEEYGYGRIDAYKAVYRAATCAQGAWPGDANKDCMVDGIDYVIWWNHYGQWTPNGPADGDFDYSGFVDDADYQIWLENYNG